VSYVEVAVPLPLFQSFTYRIDGPPPPPGTRVLVPFRQSEQVGWVLGESDPEGISQIRTILDVLESEPSIPGELIELARWISDYYVAPLGLVLRSMLPSLLSEGSREVLRVTPAGLAAIAGKEEVVAEPSGHSQRGTGAPHGRSGDSAFPLSSRLHSILRSAADRKDGIRPAILKKNVGGRTIWPEIRQLTAEGLLEHEVLPPTDAPIRQRRVVQVINWLGDLVAREELFARSPRQRACFEWLEGAGGRCDLTSLQETQGFSRAVVAGLEEKGLVVIEEEEHLRDPFRGRAAVEPPKLIPSPAQAEAIAALVEAARSAPPTPFLLHGVTGSGKTLVYIDLLKEVVGRLGRSAIVLVPEISLTPQTVSRFRAWFGEEVAVLHSALTPGERYDQWRQIRRGEKRVVVGARSALFAPLPDLGAIVVDEEHDGSYKQSEAPRYQARDVAVIRARLTGAVCVLGSATPSLESWRNVREGKFQLLSLHERVEGRPAPPVEIVDLRELRSKKRSPPEQGGGVLSPRLVAAVRDRIAKGEQTILLLNRRGYASFVQCRECGEVVECPNCSVSLTFHRASGHLRCHHCRHEEEAPAKCPGCGADELSYRGLGTEQVERVVIETFPGARIARMDVDTTSGRWSHQEILDRVERGEVDLLLGTQMIAKGLDFPRVTLVGVVNADVGIHLPDFRASERSFQLLSQVAGRAGRGPLGGEVIIQSSLPEHYVLRSVLAHDVHGFVEREMEERRNPPYPPHLRLVNVVLSSPDPELAAKGAEAAARWIRKELKGRGGEAVRAGVGSEGGVSQRSESGDSPSRIGLIGPAPSPIERLHRRWRWHFFLRGGGVRETTNLLRKFLEEFQPPAGDLRIAVDRDPVALL